MQQQISSSKTSHMLSTCVSSHFKPSADYLFSYSERSWWYVYIFIDPWEAELRTKVMSQIMLLSNWIWVDVLWASITSTNHSFQPLNVGSTIVITINDHAHRKNHDKLSKVILQICKRSRLYLTSFYLSSKLTWNQEATPDHLFQKRSGTTLGQCRCDDDSPVWREAWDRW